MYYHFDCPFCHAENTAEVDVSDRMVEFEDECEHCHYNFSLSEKDKIYEDALTDGQSTLIDAAELRLDR
jgi:transposase-like protein